MLHPSQYLPPIDAAADLSGGRGSPREKKDRCRRRSWASHMAGLLRCWPPKSARSVGAPLRSHCCTAGTRISCGVTWQGPGYQLEACAPAEGHLKHCKAHTSLNRNEQEPLATTIEKRLLRPETQIKGKYPGLVHVRTPRLTSCVQHSGCMTRQCIPSEASIGRASRQQSLRLSRQRRAHHVDQRQGGPRVR